MNALKSFFEQLRNLDARDVGRWPFLFRALAVVLVFLVATGLLVWYFVYSEAQGNIPDLRAAEAEQQSLWATFDQKQRKAANLEAYRQQLDEIERSFGAMLRQLPGRTEVPSLLVDISQSGLAAGLQEKLFQPGQETRRDFYAELPIKIRLTGGEPTVRAHIVDIVDGIAHTEGIRSVSLTTNGLLLHKLASAARANGIRGFFAYTAAHNQGMIRLFGSLPYKTNTHFEGDMVTLRCSFSEPLAK